MKLFYTVAAVAISTVLLVNAKPILANIKIGFSQNEFINDMFKYQLFALSIAVSMFVFTLILSPESRQLLKLGELNTIAIKETWLGINGKSSWQKNGLQFLLFISIPTAIFMVLGVVYNESVSNFKGYIIPVVLFLAITNSFSEEIIYRFAINGNLSQLVKHRLLFIISGILFGLPHYWGFPTGIIGVIMATALGYILSKATYETGGLGIACGIHFVQDVIIFTAILMMNVQ